MRGIERDVEGRVPVDVRGDWRRDLLADAPTLLGALDDAAASGSALDAYLLAVSLGQLADDLLEPPAPLERVTDFLVSSGLGPARVAAGALHRGRHAANSVAARRGGTTRLVAWRRDLDGAIAALAAWVLDATPSSGVGRLAARASLRRVFAGSSALSVRADAQPPVLPSCFETFDLGVADAVSLAHRVVHALERLDGHGGGRPVLVVGVRTSGSYLAPLLAHVVRGHGRAADVMTLRPGVPAAPTTVARVGAALAGQCRFVLVDDPPVTGSSFVRAAAELERLGVARRDLVVAYPCFIDTPLRLQKLDDVEQVVLPWEDWEVQRRLDPVEVHRALAELLPTDCHVTAVTRESDRRPRRAEAHVRSVYRVSTASSDGSTMERRIAVQGVGIGPYGEHVAVVASALPEHTPAVLGLRDGLLYREWFDGSARVDTSDPAAAAEVMGAVAAYVADRRVRLPADRDMSLLLAGEQPVWETAAAEISRALGRAWPAAQVVVANALAKRILSVSTPTVVDGTTELGNWFRAADGSLRTTGLQGRAYWHHGLSCYDAAFDLAGAMDDRLDVPAPRVLRDRYTTLTGDRVTDERWLLLRLAHLWGAVRRAPSMRRAARDAASRVVQEHMAATMLAGAARPGTASASVLRLAALDVDGVLEDELLGYASLSASSAFALRALRCHGFEAVLVTGRSLDEVAERCRSYGLAAGVAEYGSVLHLADTATTVDLRATIQRERIETLRAQLASSSGIALDERYRHTVRARGPKGPVSDDVLSSIDLRGIRVVRGEGQTDFVAEGVDKGTGVDALVGAMRERVSVPVELAMAVGDTVSDVPMLARATHSFVPAHASTGEGPWTRMRHPYQAGLLQAVDAMVGHPSRPGRGSARLDALGCPTCALAPMPAEREALLLLLSVAEAGRAGMAARFARAAQLIRR